MTTQQLIDVRGVRGADDAGGRDIVAAGAPDRAVWPGWARAQLDRAVVTAAGLPPGAGVATTLHRDWFAPPVGAPRLPRRPLAGLYRSAHAGAAPRSRYAMDIADVVPSVGRHDVIGTDGWWRTWGRSWTPPRSRPGSVRILFTVDPDQLGEFVRRVTHRLLDEPLPWSLAVTIEARRVSRAGAAVCDLPAEDESGAVIADVVERAGETLLPLTQPLCRPLAPGAGLAQYPDNGMTFGEHRCHLVALGLRRAGTRDPLASIADVFAAHGIDPAHPYRSH